MDRVVVRIHAKSLNPAEHEELSFTLISRGTIEERISPVELELSQYVRVRELNGHWEGVMPVILSNHSSQSRDVDDFRRMVTFLRNKGYAGRSQMESKSVYLSPSDATDENGFTILKLKFRKVPSFLDRPMRQLSSKRHSSDSDAKRRNSDSTTSHSQHNSFSENGSTVRSSGPKNIGSSLDSIAQNGSHISSLAKSLLPEPTSPVGDWTISKVTAGSCTVDLKTSVLPSKIAASEMLTTPPASPLTPDTVREHRAIDRFDRPAFKYSLLVSMADRHSAWVFGAIAELIDNSVDAAATKVEIGITHHFCSEAHPGPALFIQDNGQGMTHSEMQAMMEFGHDFTEAPQKATQRIGQYGVGFKSSVMRLGQSALVLSHSCKEQTFSLGFLSLPYNRGRTSVSVPVLSFHSESFHPLYNSPQDVENALHDVTIHTGINPIAIGSEFQLLKSLSPSGTIVLIFDLHRDDQQLDFTTDQDDIRITAPQTGPIRSVPLPPFLRNSRRHIATDIPPDYSLKTYCSMLFLNPPLKIIIRGCAVSDTPVLERMQNQKRKTFSIAAPCRSDPFGSHPGPADKPPEVEKYVAYVGFSKEDKDRALGGFLLYYRNRLILSYHRVGIQTKNLDLANGVVGVVDSKSLPVLNTKQDFNQNSQHFVTLERHLAEIVEHYYWNFVNPDVKVTPLPTRVRTDDESFWLQCNHCQKWRRVKSWDHNKPIPKFWFCRMNSDLKFNSCLSPEEPQGSSEVTTGVTSGGQISNGTTSKFSALRSYPTVTKETAPFKTTFNQSGTSEFSSKRRKL